MINSSIYDIEIFSNGDIIDKFVVAGTLMSPDDNAKWIDSYKRNYPLIATEFPNITIKVAKRD